MESSESSKSSGGILAIVLLGGVVAVVCLGELPRLLSKDSTEAPHPALAPVIPPVVAPAPVPVPVPTQAPAPEPTVAERLNAELPKLGLPPSARIVETRTATDRLTLVFDDALRGSLHDVSALDEWIGALSQRAHSLGYQHLDLRIRETNAQGTTSEVTIDSLVRTPESKRPHPEVIDDGVRK